MHNYLKYIGLLVMLYSISACWTIKMQPQPFNILKNICCFFINDSALTNEAQKRYKVDAAKLAADFTLQEYGQVYKIPELVDYIYNHLLHILLVEDKRFEHLQHLNIHTKHYCTQYMTDIHLNRKGTYWHMIFEFRFWDNAAQEWKINEWLIITEYCSLEYELVPTHIHPIPDYILQIAKENSLKAFIAL